MVPSPPRTATDSASREGRRVLGRADSSRGSLACSELLDACGMHAELGGVSKNLFHEVSKVLEHREGELFCNPCKKWAHTKCRTRLWTAAPTSLPLQRLCGHGAPTLFEDHSCPYVDQCSFQFFRGGFNSGDCQNFCKFPVHMDTPEPQPRSVSIQGDMEASLEEGVRDAYAHAVA